MVLDLTSFNSSAACLGTDARAYGSVSIPAPTGVAVVDRVTYSLYLRNNVDDTDAAASATNDVDNIVNLVSVGTVQLATGITVTKIVEEQLLLSIGGGSKGPSKNVNSQGTNTVGST